MGDIQFVTPQQVDAGSLFAGLNPEWQLAAQKVAQGNAFKDGPPIDPATGALDSMAMVKKLYGVGAYDQANQLLTVSNQQRALQAGLAAANDLDGTPAAATPQAQPSSSSYVPPKPGFDSAMDRTFGFEGALNPRDTNGTPSNYGINQAAHPDIDVTKLTPDQARGIYKSQYWDAIGGDNLSAPMSRAAFDTAVIAGPGVAKQMLAASGGDPMKFMSLREQFQNNLLQQDPSKYGPYAKAWAARNYGLRYDIMGLSRGAGSDTSSQPAPAAQASQAQPQPAQVAQNGASDEAPSVHPYGPPPDAPNGPNAPAGGSVSSDAPAIAPTQVAGPGVPAAPTIGAPATGSPVGGAMPSATDPTLGGLLKGPWVGNPGGAINHARAMAIRLGALGNTAAAAGLNQQATAIENALTRSETPEMKNFQAAQRSGYTGPFWQYGADRAGQIKAAEIAAENAPAATTAAAQRAAAITAANRQAENSAALQQELQKAQVGDVISAIQDVKPAHDELQTLGVLADAWKAGGNDVSTGPGAETALKVKQIAQNVFGLDVAGLTPSEVIQKVGTQLASQASKTMTPRPTQFDFRVFLANNPGLLLSPNGNQAMISILQQQAERRVALGQLARQQTDGKNWDNVVTNYDKAHPIISPFTNKPLDQNAVLYPAAQKAAVPNAPSVGAVMQGFRFKGGDPSSPSSWDKVQ